MAKMSGNDFGCGDDYKHYVHFVLFPDFCDFPLQLCVLIFSVIVFCLLWVEEGIAISRRWFVEVNGSVSPYRLPTFMNLFEAIGSRCVNVVQVFLIFNWSFEKYYSCFR